MKKIGISRKKKIGNYRIEKFKIDKRSNIGSVEIGCYLDVSHFKSFTAAVRRLNRLGGVLGGELGKNGLEGLIQYNELPVQCWKEGSGYAVVGLQFKLDGLSKKMDDSIWGTVSDGLINVIESSSGIVLDR